MDSSPAQSSLRPRQVGADVKTVACVSRPDLAISCWLIASVIRASDDPPAMNSTKLAVARTSARSAGSTPRPASCIAACAWSRASVGSPR